MLKFRERLERERWRKTNWIRTLLQILVLLFVVYMLFKISGYLSNFDSSPAPPSESLPER